MESKGNLRILKHNARRITTWRTIKFHFICYIFPPRMELCRKQERILNSITFIVFCCQMTHLKDAPTERWQEPKIIEEFLLIQTSPVLSSEPFKHRTRQCLKAFKTEQRVKHHPQKSNLSLPGTSNWIDCLLKQKQLFLKIYYRSPSTHTIHSVLEKIQLLYIQRLSLKEKKQF